MHVALWAAQGWLAAIFLAAGLAKLAGSKAALERRPGMGYLADLSVARMRLLGRAPGLTPLAAALLVAVGRAGVVG